MIRNREFKKQIVDFSGLRFGAISPTDLDAFIEFDNRLFVFIESKYRGAQLPYGQRLAIERLTDKSQTEVTISVAFVTAHESDGDIDLANTTVTKYRYLGKWHDPKKQGSKLVEGVIAFRKLAGVDK